MTLLQIKELEAQLQRRDARIAELESELAAIGAGGVSGSLMGGAYLPAVPEAVATVFTMEAMTPGAGVKYHATIHKPLPAGTKLYASPVPAVPAGWRPIETAPKDGTLILVREPRCSGLAVLYAGGWKYESGAICYLEPTHWAPLPPSPPMDRESNG